ncbi:MAG: MBL fold metallo-hydrolase [Raoultibacter sp.]
MSNSRLQIHVLASGSRGNAAIIEDIVTKRSLLVDCGVCKRDFFSRASEVGVDPAHIEGILVTHEHGDHTKGIGVVTRGLHKIGCEPKLYTTKAIAHASAEIEKVQETCDIEHFSADDSLSIAGVSVHVFATSHDSVESVGFRFEQDNDAIGYLTDSGVMTPASFDALKACRILTLESNHDTRMLETGPYPYHVKQRVGSDRGHLSNAQAQEALESLLDTQLKQVIAMHISENNNTYRLPREGFEEVLARNNHPAAVQTAFQHRIVSA